MIGSFGPLNWTRAQIQINKLKGLFGELLHHDSNKSNGRKKFLRRDDDQLREVEVLIISAEDLKDVKHVTKMKAYAVVYVEKDHVAKTQVDEHGGTSPTWNEVVKVKFHAKLAAVKVDIYSHGHVREKPVGSARILLCDVLKGGNASEPVDNPIQCMTVQVWRSSGRPQGLLNLWVPPTGRFLIRRESLSFSVEESRRRRRKRRWLKERWYWCLGHVEAMERKSEVLIPVVDVLIFYADVRRVKYGHFD